MKEQEMECYGNGLLEDMLMMAPQSALFDPWEATDHLRVLDTDQSKYYWDGFGNLLSPDHCFQDPFPPGSEDYGYHPLGSVQLSSDSPRSSLRGGFQADSQALERNLPSVSFTEELEGLTDLLDSMPTGNCMSKRGESPENKAEEGPAIVFAAAGGWKNRGRKPEGQCSKNLMAERRRRKRVNDRLAMLRSIVPKISRVDRTSTLGDTIDYVKELIQKITDLQHGNGLDPWSTSDILKDMKANEMLVKNTPKFEVERKNGETRIEMYCTDRAGLLLSTISTLELSGEEIQRCVISCFNDFALQASCSDGKMVGAEELKQALFRNAGYGGGKCS